MSREGSHEKKMAPTLVSSALKFYYRNQRVCSWTLFCLCLVSFAWYLNSFAPLLSKIYGGKRVRYSSTFHATNSYTGGVSEAIANINIHPVEESLGVAPKVGLFGHSKCFLLDLDPFNPSITKLLKDFGKLECRGTELYSTLSGNVLTVKGKGLHGIRYSAVQASNNPNISFVLGETKQLFQDEPSLTAGKTGAIAHFLGKCFHPYLQDTAGTKLILYSDCDAPRFKFKLEDDGTLKHVVSGLCIVPQNPDPKPNTRVVLGKDCANAKYKGLKNGFIQHTASGMCIHYRSSDPTPVNGVDVVLFDDCVKNVKMLFAWEAAYKEAKNTDVNLSVNMNDEFIHVSLVSPTTRNEDQDHEYLLQVPPKLDIQEPKHSPQIKLNILMVMFHSTSTVHFKRKMPKSHSFLAKSLTTIFMPGYSTVDESTKSQLAALLSGTSPQKLGSVPLDSLPWLFKVAKDNGYVTLFSDDKPYATDYTDTLTGFQTNPPDHYATPFWSAVYRTYTPGSNTFCIGKRAMHNISLSYVQDFFTVYSRLPKFSVIINSEVSSWNINTLGYADEDFFEFLTWMKEEGHLKRTMLVVFSDHGSRSESIREKLQGKLEERMPYLSISLPREAPKTFSAKFTNLADNSKGLVSPYDIYATLKDVVAFPKVTHHEGDLGRSLLEKVDFSDQSCGSSGIPAHWCPCLGVQKMPVSDSDVEIAKAVVKQMNGRLKKSKPSCTLLEFHELRQVAKLMPNGNVLRFRGSKEAGKCVSCEPVYDQAYSYKDFFYILYVEVSPGKQVYRAIVNSVGSDIYIHPHVVLVKGERNACTLE